jgi:TPR repeat protein
MQHLRPFLSPFARHEGVIALAGLAHGASWAGYNEGLAAYQAGRYDVALTEFSAAAALGDTRAQRSLGLMHERGQGVPRDLRQAAVWYGKAVAGGNEAAHFNLAYALAQVEARSDAVPQTAQLATRP